MHARRLASTSFVALALLSLAEVSAQCASVWQAGGGVPGADESVAALTTWDPDGAGPAAPRLVVGGAFRFVGTQSAARIATFDPASGAWAPLHLGLDGGVAAAATLANGELVVAGAFGGAFGTISPGVVRWNGTAWAAVGGGVQGVCYAVVALPTGGLVATGVFGTAGGVAANAIARWDGIAWSPLGAGLVGGFPIGRALARLPNGDLVVGGDFASAGGVAAANVARWNGSTWSALPGLAAPAQRLVVAPSGELIALAGGGLWRWSGATWSPFAAISGLSATATALDSLPNGDVAVAGDFTTIGGVAAQHLARWDGVAWHALGGVDNPRYASRVAVGPGGDLFVGGAFTAVGAVLARSIARWDGAMWRALGDGPGGIVTAQTVLPDGRHVVATDDERVLRRDGAAWTVLGGELPATIRSLAVLPNGDVLAAGDFTTYAPGYSTMVLRWNGNAWVQFATPLGNLDGVGGGPSLGVVHVLPDGRVLVGGTFTKASGVDAYNVAIWDGVVWQPLGLGARGVGTSSSNSAHVGAAATLPNGDVVIAGDFWTAGGLPSHNVARWNGSAWSAFGGGLPGVSGGRVRALAISATGEPIAVGSFTGVAPGGASYVARWSGTAWAALGAGLDAAAGAVVVLPDGDVVVGGAFTAAGGAPAVGIARWNGASWSAVAGGVGSTVSFPPAGVASLAFLPDGRLAVGGSFETSGGAFSPRLAFVNSGCPASVASTGAGCAGSGGTLQLEVTDGPWLGGAMRTRTTGLTGTSLVARVLGVAPLALPLAALHPAGGAGCDLRVDPIVVDLTLPPHAVVVDSTLAMPTSAAFIGAVFREQTVEFELDAAGAFTRLNSSNALLATVGDF